MSNLLKRSLSALILAPLFLYTIYIGGYALLGLTFVLFIAMYAEWVSLSRKLKHKLFWGIFGFFYLGIACTTFFILGLEPLRRTFMGIERIPLMLFFMLAMVWVNDISSYFVGRFVGGPKLAPKISPNKTWSGAIGGVLACISILFIMNISGNYVPSDISDKIFLITLAAHIFIPIISQIGDLFESYLKRKAGVKDSGNIIPGHGGLLDRFDGLLLVLVAYSLVQTIGYFLAR